MNFLSKNNQSELFLKFIKFILFIFFTNGGMSLSAADSVGFRELLTIMRNQSPALAATLAQVRESHHQIKAESYFLESPQLGLGLVNVPVATFPAIDRDAMSGYSVTLRQRLALPWQTAGRKQEAKLRALISQENHIAAEQQLALEVLLRYNSYYFAQERDRILRETHRALQDMRQLARSGMALTGGNSALVQRLSAELELHNNEIRQNLAVKEGLRFELSAFLGVELAFTHVADDLKEELLSRVMPALDLSLSPIYRAALHQEQAATSAVSRGKSEVFGEVMIGGGYQARRPSAMSRGEDMVSFEISVPLPLTYPLRDTERIAALKAAQEASKWRAREVALRLEAAAEAERRRERALSENLQSIRESVLPLLQNALKSQLAQVVSGKADLQATLLLYKEIKDARLRELEAIRELCESRLRLLYFAGRIFEL